MIQRKNNARIRIALRENAIRQWEIAEALGVTEGYISRLFRHELQPKQREQIEEAIQQIIEQREKEVRDL